VPRNKFLSSLPRVSSGLHSRLSSYQVVCATEVKPSPIYYAGAGVRTSRFSSRASSLAPLFDLDPFRLPLPPVSCFPVHVLPGSFGTFLLFASFPLHSHTSSTIVIPGVASRFARSFFLLRRGTICKRKLYQQTLTANVVTRCRYRVKPSRNRGSAIGTFERMRAL